MTDKQAIEIRDLYCKWCPREQECDEHLSLEEKRGCLACDGFADELRTLGYRLVPELKVLSDESNDRLTYLPNEFLKDGRPKVDEVVLSNASIHLESLSDQCFMLIADNHKHHWHLSICSDSPRSKLHAVVLEEENK